MLDDGAVITIARILLLSGAFAVVIHIALAAWRDVSGTLAACVPVLKTTVFIASTVVGCAMLAGYAPASVSTGIGCALGIAERWITGDQISYIQSIFEV